MALLPRPNASGSSIRRTLTNPAPWRELSQAVGGAQILVGSSRGICLWSLDLSASSSPQLGPLHRFEVPLPGIYRHLVHRQGYVLSTLERSTGGAELGMSSSSHPYKRLVDVAGRLVAEVDRSGRSDRFALWRSDQPNRVEVGQVGQLGTGTVAGTIIDLSAHFASTFPSGAEISQLVLHDDHLGVLAQPVGSGTNQVFFSVSLANIAAIRVVQTGLVNATIAVNDDAAILGDRRQPGAFPTTQVRGVELSVVVQRAAE